MQNKLLIICFLLSWKTLSAQKETRRLVINAKSGPVQGILTDGCVKFMGIPYATPPTGPLRWQAPQPVRPWAKVRDASKPCSPCPQLPVAYANTASENEDCLYLNITAPASKTGSTRRPVMVWLHGDGAVGSGDLFDPSELVRSGNVIVVTINYRLSVFGGFGYPGLVYSGTFGLLDQQEALRWIKTNIAAFGGDPGNVTLFGVSYGALSAGLQLLSPTAKGLFHKVILQSGFMLMDLPAGAVFPGIEAMDWFGLRETREVKEIGAQIGKQLCSESIASLRKRPVKDLLPFLQVFQSYAFGNSVVPTNPESALRRGAFNHIPVLAGNTGDEHRTFVGLFRVLAKRPVTAAQYPVLLDSAFGKKARQVEKQYPLTKFKTPALALATVFTDYMWAKSTFRQHQLFSHLEPVYAYEFHDRNAPTELPFPKDMPPGAYHNADVDYLFPTRTFQAKLTARQQALSKKMITYWTQFAWKGKPASPAEWKAFDRKDQVPFVLSLAPDRIGPIDYEQVHQLHFWQKLTT